MVLGVSDFAAQGNCRDALVGFDVDHGIGIPVRYVRNVLHDFRVLSVEHGHHALPQVSEVQMVLTPIQARVVPAGCVSGQRGVRDHFERQAGGLIMPTATATKKPRSLSQPYCCTTPCCRNGTITRPLPKVSAPALRKN